VKFIKLTSIVSTLALLLVSSSAFATLIIGNFPPSNDDSASTIAASTGSLSKAAGFTMGANNFELDSATLRLRVNDVNATMSLGLYGDGGAGAVGPELLSFSIPTLVAGIADITFTSAAAFVLQANTTYWLTASGASPTANGIQWLASNPGITPTGPAATNAGYAFNSTGGLPPTSASSILNTYRIDGTAVPVPTTLALFGLGLVGFGWSSRKKAQG
jgi:hypothetical protein